MEFQWVHKSHQRHFTKANQQHYKGYCSVHRLIEPLNRHACISKLLGLNELNGFHFLFNVNGKIKREMANFIGDRMLTYLDVIQMFMGV